MLLAGCSGSCVSKQVRMPHIPLSCAVQYLPPTAVITSQRLQALRATMRPLNISAYIIPGTDAHLVP